MKYLQFQEEGYTLYHSHRVNESEILTFHVSSKWKITKYNLLTQKKTQLLEEIPIYTVRQFPNNRNCFALMTAQGLMVADFANQIYKVLVPDVMGHQIYDNTKNSNISACGRYLLQNVWDPDRTLVFKFERELDLKTQQPALIKEIEGFVDDYLVVYKDSFISAEGKMAKIEDMTPSAKNRKYRLGKGTIVLYENENLVLLFSGPKSTNKGYFYKAVQTPNGQF